jgi:hypothetical protein
MSILRGLLENEEFLLGAGLLSAGTRGQGLGQAVFPQMLQAAKTSAIFKEAAKKEETSNFVKDFKKTLPSNSPLQALPDSAMVDYITKSEIAKINKRSALTTSMKNAMALGLSPGTKEYDEYIRGSTLKTDAAVNQARQAGGEVLNPSQRDKIVKDNKFVQNMGIKLNDVINKIDKEPSLAGLKGAARRFGNQIATAGKDFGVDISSFLPKGSKEFLFDDDIATINALENLIAPGYARVLFPAQKITNLQITEAKKALALTGLTGADEVKARLTQISKDFDQFIETNQSLLGSQSGIKKFRMVNGVLVEIVE